MMSSSITCLFPPPLPQGISLIKELIDGYSLDVVLAYMGHIQSNAEIAVREMLRQIGRNTLEKTGKTQLSATDHMDDGTPIVLSIDINVDEVIIRIITQNLYIRFTSSRFLPIPNSFNFLTSVDQHRFGYKTDTLRT